MNHHQMMLFSSSLSTVLYLYQSPPSFEFIISSVPRCALSQTCANGYCQREKESTKLDLAQTRCYRGLHFTIPSEAESTGAPTSPPLAVTCCPSCHAVKQGEKCYPRHQALSVVAKDPFYSTSQLMQISPEGCYQSAAVLALV